MELRRLGGSLAAPVRAALLGGERMTPGFLIVGTKRGGSTAVYHWITRHPQVAPARTRKGTHYFDVNYHRGEAWFRSGFEHPRPRWLVTGEASPYYMFHPLAPARIRQTLPDVRLIVLLRDPVRRAWSHHQYETAQGFEELPFEQALDAESGRLAGEEARLVSDPAYESFAHRHHAYRARGEYADQLERLYQLFPPEQVLVLQSERLFAHPASELSRVWAFLGLEPVDLGGLRPMKEGPKGGGPMPEPARQELAGYYEPLNQRLYALPGVDFRWDEAITPEAGVVAG